MPRFATPLLLFFLLLPSPGLAQAPSQPTSVRGRFEDATTRAAVPSVSVKLTAVSDSGDVHRVAAKDDGTFAIAGLGVHSYRLEATRLGYAPLKTIVRVTKKDQDLGVLAMVSESVPVAGITVTESPAPAVVRADTTEFRASAVKINKDATAEELVQKMPGVTLENGQVKAHGENVQQVLVNGRPFFGSDPTAAMRNLPAEVVDRIQVYDRMSDQAEFSGFDDGQSQKTMNFILRDQKAKFGKIYGGGGDQDLYQAGGNLSVVRGATRTTLIGMSNNINQKNFSAQDLFGAMSGNAGGGGGPRIMMMGGGGGPRPGGGQQIIRMGGGFGGGAFDPGNFMVGQQPGISTTHAGGANYTGEWGKTLKVSSSLFLNSTDTDNTQSVLRQYVPPQGELAFYDQQTTTGNSSGNQRLDARFEWTPDSLNSVIFQPRLYFQQSDATSDADAENRVTTGSVIGAARTLTEEQIDGNNLSGRLTLRHRFGKRGRNVSADLNTGGNRRDGDNTQFSLTDSYDTTGVTRDTLDQRGDSRTVTRSYSARIAYTEPLRPGLQAQLIFNPSLTHSTSDARTNRLDPATGTYSTLDSVLSNSYENRNTSRNAGVSVLWTKGPWRVLGNASYQRTDLSSEQTFPRTSVLDRTFDEVLPSATITGNFSNRRSLRLAWNTSTTNPTIGQLQNVVNNSNPLSLSAGNPDLRPTYNHSLSLRWSEADPMKSRSRFLFANVTRTAHPIASAIFVAPSDTTVRGIFLARGTQLTVPENLDESWNANLFAVVSRPVKKIRSIASLNGGGSYTQTPTQVTNTVNVGRTYAARAGAVLASNISPNLDFTLSWQGTYTFSRSTLTTGSSGDYGTQVIGLRFNAVAQYGVVIREEFNYNLQNGMPSAYGQDVALWTSTLGKKFMKGDRGEIRVTATDVLGQNRSENRSVTETYVQDTRDRVLGRYVQAVFTYSFK
jgi:hypothetical protein